MDSLAHASDHTVRAILTALCDDPRVRAKALRYLEALEPEAESRAKVAATSQPNLKKRKPTSTLSICVQCGDTFLEDCDEQCKYHPGERVCNCLPTVATTPANITTGHLELDYESDFWADEPEGYEVDTPEMREESPDGFVWTCCEKLGSEPGCQLGRHESNPERSKKGRC